MLTRTPLLTISDYNNRSPSRCTFHMVPHSCLQEKEKRERERERARGARERGSRPGQKEQEREKTWLRTCCSDLPSQGVDILRADYKKRGRGTRADPKRRKRKKREGRGEEKKGRTRKQRPRNPKNPAAFSPQKQQSKARLRQA